MNVFDKAPILDKEAFVTVILEDDHLFGMYSFNEVSKLLCLQCLVVD